MGNQQNKRPSSMPPPMIQTKGILKNTSPIVRSNRRSTVLSQDSRVIVPRFTKFIDVSEIQQPVQQQQMTKRPRMQRTSSFMIYEPRSPVMKPPAINATPQLQQNMNQYNYNVRNNEYYQRSRSPSPFRAIQNIPIQNVQYQNIPYQNQGMQYYNNPPNHYFQMQSPYNMNLMNHRHNNFFREPINNNYYR